MADYFRRIQIHNLAKGRKQKSGKTIEIGRSVVLFCAIIRLCMGMSHLKIRYHKRGLCLNKDCIINMTVLHHEYKGGCILISF